MRERPSFSAEAAAARLRLEHVLQGWLVWFSLGTVLGGAIFWP